MCLSNKKFVLLILIVIVSSIMVGCGKSEDPDTSIKYPTGAIEIVVPFAPGGAVDITIRALAEEVEKHLGQKLLVVNRPGAIVGQSYVARSKPDGYTLLAFTSSVVTNALMKGDEAGFTMDSFDPVMMYCYEGSVIVTYPGSPFQTIQEMIEYGKTNEITHASSGHGTSHHIALVLLENLTKTKWLHLHLEGGAGIGAQVAGGHYHVAAGSIGAMKPMVDQGKLVVLANTAPERDSRSLDVPTLSDLGFDLKYTTFRGIAAPAGTPPEIMKILEQAFKAALESPETIKKFETIQFPIVYMGTEDFRKFLEKEVENVQTILPLLN